MSKEVRGSKAISWDLDDTLFQRERVTRVVGSLVGKVKKPGTLPDSIDEIQLLDRTMVDIPFRSRSEKVAYRYHKRRVLFDSVTTALDEASANNFDNYVNTGRENKKIWVDMTKAALRDGKIEDRFSGFYFTPEGESRNVSKADAIRDLKKRYESVTHVDDDPRTIFYLAKLYPDVQFYLVQYGSTGLLYDKKEADTFKNVRRIGNIGEISFA